MTASASLRLSYAVGEYDHVADLTNGRVRPEGIELVPLDLPIEEIFWRMLKYEEFDVSELSMGMYTSLISRGNDRFVGIPVFPSRVFRHSSIFVRRASGYTDPRQLRGLRIGIPQWSQTAVTYVRGMLVDQYGLALEDIRWFQAGVNQAGREEPATLKLPAGIEITGKPDRSLNDMLLAGEIDAMISARPPDGALTRDPAIVRLFDDYVAVEQAYFRETGIFPIMHVIALRRSTYEKNSWIARSLYTAFETARRRALARLADGSASRVAVPWLTPHLAVSAQVLGPDLFAYGIEPNRTTLEAFVRWCALHGVAHREIAIEELFAPEMGSEYRV